MNDASSEVSVLRKPSARRLTLGRHSTDRSTAQSREWTYHSHLLESQARQYRSAAKFACPPVIPEQRMSAGDLGGARPEGQYNLDPQRMFPAHSAAGTVRAVAESRTGLVPHQEEKPYATRDGDQSTAHMLLSHAVAQVLIALNHFPYQDTFEFLTTERGRQ